jgi:exo-beta-1,3-glucanase (GH17 family)
MSPHRQSASWRGFAIVLSVAGALAAEGCAPGHSTAGTGGGAGVSGAAGGTAGSVGAAGAAGGGNGAAGTAGGTNGAAGGTNGAAGGTNGGAAGTNGGAGAQAGATGSAGGATGSAGGTNGGAGGTNGGAGGAGATAGVGGVAGGPAAYSTKPLSVVAYAPFRDGQAPGGAQPTLAQVKADLQMLKPLVDGVRVYGTDGANGFIPALCDELGIDLHLGAWIDGIATDEPNVHALAKIVNENHPSLKTAIIGNEVLARASKLKNNVTEERMIQLINIAKADITVKTVKIATADTYPEWMKMRPNLAAAVDLLIWHTYAYWSGADISGSYALVAMRYDDMLAAYPGKPMLLGETGWPTLIDHPSTDLTTTSVANEANQARFYREALAGFRARNLPMWMFSAIDEKWKATSGEGEVGAHWGIFTSARLPKAAATALMMK